MFEISTTPVSSKYERPETLERQRTIVWLGRTDRLVADVQVVTEGGETNLHSHGHLDGFWYVLKGRAKFYGEDNVLLGDLGPNQGILLPRGSKYLFVSDSAEPLEILQVEVSDKPFRTQEELMADRTDYTPSSGYGAADVQAATAG